MSDRRKVGTMKAWMVGLVAAAALLAGCGDGVTQGATSGVELKPDDLRIITVDWRGKKCDLAYVYIENNPSGLGRGSSMTGGPALANLGCY